MKFGTVIHQPEGLLDVVHVDVCGPSKGASVGGHKWFVSFVDEYSRRVWIATMARKGEVLDIFKKWKKCVEVQVRGRSENSMAARRRKIRSRSYV